MAKQSLPIIDGTQALTSLEVDSGSFGYIPYHAISGTINVSASATSPVYVTGNVSVNQPINVDVDISDKLTVVVSSSENNNTVWVTSSATYPIYSQLSNITTVGVPGAGTALVVSLSGSTGSFNQVQLYDSYVTVANTGTNQLIGYLTAAIDLGDSDYRLKVITTGSSAVTINNSAADAAFTALSYSFAENSIKVKLTGSNTVKEGTYDILLVRGTGSQTEITNTGFQQLVNYLTAAVDFGDNDYRLKVITTGSSAVTINNAQADEAFIALSSSQTNEGLRVKLSGSNTINEGGYDIIRVRTTGSSVTVDNTGFQQAVNYITAAVDTGDSIYKILVKTTGSSAVTIDNNYFNDAITAISASSISGSLRVSFLDDIVQNIDSDKALLVVTTGSSITEVTNTVYVTSSISNPVIITTRPIQNGVDKTWYRPELEFNWTSSLSGTIQVAGDNEERRSLSIFNPSPYNLYVAVGDKNDLGYINGFLLQTTTSAPAVYSFIIYPQGAYFADEYMSKVHHALFFISQSDNFECNAYVTRIGS